MGKLLIGIKIQDGYCESKVQMIDAIIGDLNLANSELDLIKIQILEEIKKQRISKQ